MPELTMDERTERMKELCEKYEQLLVSTYQFAANALEYIPLVIAERERRRKLIADIRGAFILRQDLPEFDAVVDAAMQKEKL